MKRSLGIICVILLSSCSGNTSFSNLGSSLLSSTGLVSSSQADAIMKASSELAEAATPLTDEQEYYLGRGVSATILSKYKLAKNESATQYLNRVGAVVAAVSDKPETFGGYHFAILNSDEVNAVSAPGGFVFVSRGLLKQVHDEDMLAAVLAHEVAHIVKAHGVNAISEGHMSKALVLLGKEAVTSAAGQDVQMLTSAFSDSITDVANSLLTKGYSRRQEYEADEYAAELLKRAGYNPHALVKLLEGLKGLEGSSSGGWMSTHPDAEDRIDEVESVAKDDENSKKNLPVRAQRFKSNMNV
ncbi:MAG: M48 family metalloprotease [Oligoflexia bacterium]|nr:M48 family metalloprotease [Oligoflexia bacterium]